MTVALKIGDRTFSGGDVISQLEQYGLLPALVKELVLESALEAWSNTSADVWSSAEEAQVVQQVKTQQALQAMAPQKGPQPPGADAAMEKMAVKRAKLDKYKESLWGNKVETYFLQRKVRLDRVIYSLLRLKDARSPKNSISASKARKPFLQIWQRNIPRGQKPIRAD